MKILQNYLSWDFSSQHPSLVGSSFKNWFPVTTATSMMFMQSRIATTLAFQPWPPIIAIWIFYGNMSPFLITCPYYNYQVTTTSATPKKATLDRRNRRSQIRFQLLVKQRCCQGACSVLKKHPFFGDGTKKSGNPWEIFKNHARKGPARWAAKSKCCHIPRNTCSHWSWDWPRSTPAMWRM